MGGARRVIMFCMLTTFLPVIILVIPLYLRHQVFADVSYKVAESAVLKIDDGISSIFCKEHTLKMNKSFNAVQVEKDVHYSPYLYKHLRMTKSMSLPDDTHVSWGVYLPRLSYINLLACSKFEGARIMVVYSEKELRNCGLKKPEYPHHHMAQGHGTVYVQHGIAAKAEPAQDRGFDGEVSDEHTVPSFSPTSSFTSTDSSVGLEERKKLLSEVLNKDVLEKPFGNHIKKRDLLSPEEKSIGKSINTTLGEDSSISSFENTLFSCYDGDIILTEGFEPSEGCNSTDDLENVEHFKSSHNNSRDGYYYYIFYSDNDYVTNDIHAIFDIDKPSFHNVNSSQKCINQTLCSFSIPFLSDEVVVVEVPTVNGIENESDFSILISTCHPRPAVYAIFPILILLLVLTCAFL